MKFTGDTAPWPAPSPVGTGGFCPCPWPHEQRYKRSEPTAWPSGGGWTTLPTTPRTPSSRSTSGSRTWRTRRAACAWSGSCSCRSAGGSFPTPPAGTAGCSTPRDRTCKPPALWWASTSSPPCSALCSGAPPGWRSPRDGWGSWHSWRSKGASGWAGSGPAARACRWKSRRLSSPLSWCRWPGPGTWRSPPRPCPGLEAGTDAWLAPSGRARRRTCPHSPPDVWRAAARSPPSRAAPACPAPSLQQQPWHVNPFSLQLTSSVRCSHVYYVFSLCSLCCQS